MERRRKSKIEHQDKKEHEKLNILSKKFILFKVFLIIILLGLHNLNILNWVQIKVYFKFFMRYVCATQLIMIKKLAKPAIILFFKK